MAATALIVDARGERCPLPVLRMEKALAPLGVGESIMVLATDPMARIDIPLFCTQNGHGCETSNENDVLKFEITKG
jgi:tRNA 2-thiouridine synthesizing protein A